MPDLVADERRPALHASLDLPDDARRARALRRHLLRRLPPPPPRALPVARAPDRHGGRRARRPQRLDGQGRAP
jgi:hypothetical protein